MYKLLGSFLARLFEENVKLLRLLACRRCHAKQFIAAHYSKGIKDINTKISILAHQDKV